MGRHLHTIFALIFMGFLFLLPFVANGGLIDDLRQQIAAKSQEVKDLQQRAAEAKQSLAEAQSKERSLQNQIYKFNKQIEALELEIAVTEEQIDEVKLKIEEIEIKIKQTQEAINLEKSRIASTLQLIYETGPPDIVELSLNAKSLSSMFQNLYSVQKLEGELKTRLNVAQELSANLVKDEADAKAQENNLVALRTQLTLQQELTEDQRSEKNILLKDTRQQETVYQKSVKQLESQQTEIQKNIIALEAKLRFAIDPSSLPKGKGILSWPVNEVRITQYYGPTSETGFINDGYQFHNGIDLAPSTGLGTPIYSAGDGKVIAVGNDGRYAYGKWVAIDHKNGLITLYAHLSKQAVSVGATVSKGDVIGFMGSTGFSTGSHLHFTVYATSTFEVIDRWYGPLPLGGHLDPLEYL
ncbi:MAG: hypothetical protein A3A80_04415 [Candidatus Terrybacteria bacterium RIFCSPLOWO2_01_FULL_44_24]|uniref:M23ase beta-sheet core domain-containing protein n=1 Tax=Candidatus Terrybacteria bacterium RIFCSPHIGHO2_01_FULL_43_35 TaxID=1802361 RepID=A0A1G2PC28_9BACT|nr:MAG: hypothetical protein A2828_01290 [Candidatus Terrybacteria bacterium RIFCSPHIGHO2_01_FULL_43_35]OHA51329.1 MAG: hypothetical protein A3A80_04415 [Candidatus Terrybacteria bacterium RIFCSPLOWO2_01_FULL_44_24]